MDRRRTVELGTRTMTSAEFKAKCLALMDEVNASGDVIVITKRGRPVAKLEPYRVMPDQWLGRDRDAIEIHGDLIEPVEVDWGTGAAPDQVLDS